jgi:hypothetical protein
MSQSEVVQHRRVSNRKIMKIEEDESYVDEVVEELSNGVDLRRAMVYHTILETPYVHRF